MLPRAWGRKDLGPWFSGAPRPEGAIGEVWAAHANNVTESGEHIGRIVSDNPQAMLGELGRSPPSIRMAFTSEEGLLIDSDAPVGVWRILDCDPKAMLAHAPSPRPAAQLRGPRNALYRIAGQRRLRLPSGMIAIETRASFTPQNGADTEGLTRLPRPSQTPLRTTWMRDPALSVEVWTLPVESRLEPDGETCHVLVALSPGAAIDGHLLQQGQAVLIPAEGRAMQLTGNGAQVLVAYPDLLPTTIWRHTPHPDPAMLARLSAWRSVSSHLDGAKRAASG
jgi:hypothetical protein